MTHITKHVLIALGLGLALAPSGRALDIVRYSSETYDRFVPGTYPLAPQGNSNFKFSSLDWSGVGWNIEDPRKNVAMISPRHFVAASHFPPGGHIAFMGAGGIPIVMPISGTIYRLVDPISGWLSDLYVGELSEALPAESGITPYGIMDLVTPEAYIGLPLLVYGHQPREGGGAAGVSVGVNTVEGFQQDLFCEYLCYFDQDKGGGEARAESGDSGSPTFTVVGSTLALMGCHSSIGAIGRKPVTRDTFIPNFIDQISDIIAADGYSLPPIPEQPVEGSTKGPNRGKK